MDEEVKISFWKKIKISVWKLEDYQKLAEQRPTKTIGYLAKLMLIFALLLSIVMACNFGIAMGKAKEYIENEISEINFENNTLAIKNKENVEEPIIIDNENFLNGKIIIDTTTLDEEQVEKYTKDISSYINGIVILKDKIIFKTGMTAVSTTISLSDVANQYNIVKLDKQDLLNMLSGSNIVMIYAMFIGIMLIYLFIIYFSTVLIDVILYSLLAYITAKMASLRLKYIAAYNIAAHALTFPIILNLIYIIVNTLTGFTIKYFNIMYIAITCIYIITAILLVRTDLIKKQIELSKIISEQEKVRAEMERQAKEKQEEEERERVRKEDEEKRKKEKENKNEDKDVEKDKDETENQENKKSKKKNEKQDNLENEKRKSERKQKEPINPKDNNPEPQVNIKEGNT